ncbi:MAG: hypothetical protein H0X17_07535 [Deltaproteobacteria bacterium]|nr:hypothetical protein [Deltaproteobacteria bacterium]
MRAGWISLLLLLLLLLGGCPLGTTGGAGECDVDADCSGDVCARDGFCHSAGSVRAVRVTWTVNGMPASAAACTSAPDLAIYFSGKAAGDDPLGFAPVPCETGQFVIDKLPTSYSMVELGRDGAGFPDVKSISSSNVVTFDLRL